MARILVIDDEKSMRNLYKLLLERYDHEVITTSNGKQAMAFCSENPFDLIVTDIFMPEMDGLEFIREVLNKWSTIKIIAISGGNIHMSVDFLEVAKLMGADCSFQKPVNNKQFLLTVNHYLSQE